MTEPLNMQPTPNPKIAIRAATSLDVPAICAHRFFDEQPLPEAAALYASWLTQAMHEGRYLGFVAHAEDALVAGVGATLLDWGPTRADPNPIHARIVNVYTAPQSRRQGIARGLMQQLLAALSARGIESLHLSTTEVGASLYRSFGFKEASAERVRLKPRWADRAEKI